MPAAIETNSGGNTFTTFTKTVNVSVNVFAAGNKALPTAICKFSTSLLKFLKT